MFCSKCGNEIDDEAVVCLKCGCKTNNFTRASEAPSETDNVSGGLVVLSICFPIVGIILGIVNFGKSRSKSGAAYILSGVLSWIVSMIIIFGIMR